MEHNSHDENQTGIKQPKAEEREVELPDLSGNRVIFDTNIFISERNRADSFMQRIGNPKVYHTDITFDELYKNYKKPDRKRKEVLGQILRSFAAFNSSPLPRTGKTRKIARRISRYLKRAGVPRKTVRQEKNDTTIVAYGMLRGIDVLTADELFYVMDKIFTTGIELHLTWKKKPKHRAAQAKAILKKKGIKTPVDLTHLLDKAKTKKRHTPRKEA